MRQCYGKLSLYILCIYYFKQLDKFRSTSICEVIEKRATQSSTRSLDSSLTNQEGTNYNQSTEDERVERRQPTVVPEMSTANGEAHKHTGDDVTNKNENITKEQYENAGQEPIYAEVDMTEVNESRLAYISGQPEMIYSEIGGEVCYL